ncbi:uncharacterized protein G2W53_038332 [Senna tora]|uniref:Uncharacterized protein n=1 Tax=Senna tora TaxID=362788 RepID=A0A834SMY7_9FABA|nr:uncharacterized protein G2W53_038332 [Senna tora]
MDIDNMFIWKDNLRRKIKEMVFRLNGNKRSKEYSAFP